MPRVMVIEDSPTQAQLLTIVLEDGGFEVEAAPDAETGYRRLTESPFDIVLSDLHLPGEGGFDLCRRLKAHPDLSQVPIVVCTSEADPVNVLRGLQAGADGFFTKDREPDEIVGAVRRVLARPVASAESAPRTPVTFLGQEFELTAGRAQLLNILVSAFEDVVHLNRRLEEEKARADELLHVILPDKIVMELKATNTVRPRLYEDVAVLFADIVGFTHFCDQHQPEIVVEQLQQFGEAGEEIALRHDVQKIKTIGDALMAACGLLQKVENPVLNCVRCGLELIEATQGLPSGWQLRVGIHFGRVMAGVIGHRQYLFDLWGDTVNKAARMESHGVPGSITLSREAWVQVASRCRGESLGFVAVKGKGEVEMFRLIGFRDDR